MTGKHDLSIVPTEPTGDRAPRVCRVCTWSYAWRVMETSGKVVGRCGKHAGWAVKTGQRCNVRVEGDSKACDDFAPAIGMEHLFEGGA